MARYVVTKAVLIAFSNYSMPGRQHKIGDIIELSTAEVTTIGAGNLRTTTPRDVLGEAVGASNSS